MKRNLSEHPVLAYNINAALEALDTHLEEMKKKNPDFDIESVEVRFEVRSKDSGKHGIKAVVTGNNLSDFYGDYKTPSL